MASARDDHDLFPPPPEERPPMPESRGPRFESVAALTSRLRQALERDFDRVLVEGEVSNWRPGPSGHVYFSLKDKSAVLNCVLWRSTAQRPAVAARLAEVRDGSTLRLVGRITVYEPRGTYQLAVSDLQIAGGLGELHRLFVERKERLQREGLFDPERKRPVPAMAKRVGVVTSAGGAALRDVLNVARRRCPGSRFVVEHASVQGAEAPAQLVDALARLAVRAGAGEIEVAIICRGGGSFEDLWAFNDEALARAVAAFPIPIISGVGHEVDWSLCDFAADLRAPTPSAASEAATPNKAEQIRRLEQLSKRSKRLVLGDLETRRLRLERLARHPAFQDPGYAINRWRQRLDDLETRMERSARTRLASGRRKLDALSPRLAAVSKASLAERSGKLRSLSGRLGALDPEGVLRRGYALVSRKTARGEEAIASPGEAPAGARLSIRFAEGEVAARSLGTSEGTLDQTELDF